jgi:hypothetical protein
VESNVVDRLPPIGIEIEDSLEQLTLDTNNAGQQPAGRDPQIARNIKGTVSRDFQLLFFFMKQF